MEKLSIPTFVKWAGGKKQLLEQFELLFPDKINRYFEPFVGSGAVFFYLKQTCKPDYCMISDNNQNLINLYLSIRDNLEELLELLTKFKKKHMQHPKEYYYQQRKEFNETTDALIKSALLIYLNKTCYNGLYRVNSKGEFNVPMGRYKNPSIVQPKLLQQASKHLQQVDIKNMDFEKVLDFTQPGDFIYFDPPYYPLSATSSFTSYQKDVFLENEQKKLAQVFQKLDEKGCYVMLSNSDTAFIHNLYEQYFNKNLVTKVYATRMINCDGSKRGAISEIVVRNYQYEISSSLSDIGHATTRCF